jgi:hypothetical protein
MKTFKVIAVLLTFSIVSLIVESCIGEKCPKRESKKYSLSSFSIFSLDSETIIRDMDFIQTQSPEMNLHTFRKDFVIDIGFYSTVSMIAKYKPSKSLFIQSAYALSCPPPIYYPVDSITSIQIFSDKNFDETHLAGTDIAEFFRILSWNGQSYHFLSFEDYLQRPAPILEGLEIFGFRSFVTVTDVESGEHNFRIVVELSDERTLEQTIKKIFE